MKLEVNDTNACGVAAQFVVLIVVSVQNNGGMQEMSEGVSGGNSRRDESGGQSLS